MFRASIEKIRRASEFRRRYGTGPALIRLVDRLGERAVNLGVSHVMWLPVENIRTSRPRDATHTFRFLTAEEVRRFAAVAENQLDGSLADRLVGGHDGCFAALAGQRLAAYAWYAPGCVEPEHTGNIPVSYPPNVAYQYNAFTHPDFRGNRLHALTTAAALNMLAGRGVRNMFSLVSWSNAAALRSCTHLRCVDLGYLVNVGRRRNPLSLGGAATNRFGIRFGRHAEREAKCSRLLVPGNAPTSS